MTICEESTETHPTGKKTRQIGKIKGMIMHRILFMEWISFPVTHQVDLFVKIHL
jgi:hypothetical protein